ncbi:hypothetical protein I4F81_010806 [Pyropia yezoensis]|uniref:Uncharacterized protein n=1 Tax=Pyropia yezoensis TaxID=2788 RepID=A0ACC3CEX1_PYRYE|nr:hypothetical protein I4F81_010806 [Neopyropia yezoensis]
MRDLTIKHGRQLFNMDETHVRARDLLQGARVSIVGPWAKQFFPNEEKLLCPDGAKVHLSVAGLLVLQEAKVTVIAEPSKTSHVLQALDTPSLSGRFQPALRRGIRTQCDTCVMEGRRFNVLDLMDCVRAAALEALTGRTLASAFQRVGLWPLDPSRVSQEMLRKGADRPAPDVDLALLAARLVPVVRKEMAQPVVTNKTLSTAGTAVVLTAPQVIQALQDVEQDKLDKADAKETGKRAREQRASDKLAEKAAKDAAAKRRRAELVWRQVCQLSAEVAQLRVSAVLPTLRKQTHRGGAGGSRDQGDRSGAIAARGTHGTAGAPVVEEMEGGDAVGGGTAPGGAPRRMNAGEIVEVEGGAVAGEGSGNAEEPATEMDGDKDGSCSDCPETTPVESPLPATSPFVAQTAVKIEAQAKAKESKTPKKAKKETAASVLR